MVPTGGVLNDASTPGACHRSRQAGFVFRAFFANTLARGGTPVTFARLFCAFLPCKPGFAIARKSQVTCQSGSLRHD